MKVTPAFGPMSGKMGGTVASHNRGGAYFRAKSIPTNPNSTRQQAVRAIMTGLVGYWGETLTVLQRDAWKTYADNTPYNDVLGQSIVMTGQNAFIANNVARQQAGLPAVLDAPVIYDHGQMVANFIGDVAGDDVVGSFSINSGLLDANTVNLAMPPDDDGDLLVYFGRPVSVGTNFYKGPYQFYTSAPVTSGNAAVTLETLTIPDLTYPLTVGQRRPVKMVVAYDDGRTSTIYEQISEIIPLSE
jgi:hypothetical protein